MTELAVISDLSREACEDFFLDVAEADESCNHAKRPTDTRFRDLMGAEAWARLPDVVRSRFSRRLEPGTARIFAGTVSETRLSRIGRIVGAVARLVGGPLPFTDGATGPSHVVVTESVELGGQIWTRTYARPGKFPQTINSVKRFAGPTGLEEDLGFGLVMRLTLAAEAAPDARAVAQWATEATKQNASEGAGNDAALVFRSAGYDVAIGRFRFAWPGFLSPGCCTITHRAIGDTRFSFTLALDHPWAGRLATQVAYFEEITP